MAPQFSKEERNFLLFEYVKRKGGMDFLPGLIQDFQAQFPGTRPPAPKAIWATALVIPTLGEGEQQGLIKTSRLSKQ